MALVMTFVVSIIVPIVVPIVMPLLGSLLAPLVAFRIETANGQAEGSSADGQEEKTAFHRWLLSEMVVG
jgi:hypothetical protein